MLFICLKLRIITKSILTVVIILILNFISIYNYTKAQNIIILIKIQTTLESFSSIYKANDISNVHVKSLYLHYVQSFQMSRDKVERPSSNTFLFG